MCCFRRRASDIYKPTLNAKQWQWRDNLAKEIKRSIESSEAIFRRATYYDEAIELLFPEMEEKLSSSFATDRDNRTAAAIS